MASQSGPVPRLELHFEHQNGGPVLIKTYFAKDKDAVAKKTQHTSDSRVQWRPGAMALMWFFVKSKLDRGPELTWLPCEPQTLMGSVHDSIKASHRIQWHNRVFGDYQLPALIALVQPSNRPMRRLNTQELPTNHIVVYVDGKPAVEFEKLEAVAEGIRKQWEKAAGKLLHASSNVNSDVLDEAGAAKRIRLTQFANGVLTIVEIDLVGYTNIAFILEENVGPDAVAKLNKDIQDFVDVGLAAVSCPRERGVWQTTGDGAIIVFEHAENAHRFAVAVNQATQMHNEQVRKPESKRHFRIGAATGKVSTTTGDLAGTKIIEAVRFGSCAREGEFVIDLSTYELLPEDLRSKYGPVEKVSVKKDTFQVRRCLMSANATPEAIEVSDFVDPPINTTFEIPYQQNPFFTGRDEQLGELRRRMTKGNAVATIQGICGLGGIGKSQLAVHYAFRHRTDYSAVFWVRSDTRGQLTDGYFGIAQRMNLPYDERKREDVIPVVKHWLRTNSDWLLIFDNADAPLLLKDYLPNVRGGHIIVTSRVNRLDSLGIIWPLELPKLSREQATNFLLRRTGREPDSTERPFAESLAVEIDGLPLALEQAGAYILRKAVGFERYLKTYQSARSRIALLDKEHPVTGDYSATVATTWLVNFKEVEKESSASAELLRISSFLEPDCIPFDMIIGGAPELGPELHAFISRSDDPILAVAEALEPLARFSLVHVDASNETYSMHRLVQEVLKARDDT